MFQRLVGIILPVFLVIALGFAYAKRNRPDMTWVNRINLNVLAPALIFSALASKDFDLAANRALILGAIGVVAGSGLLAWPFAKLLHEDVRTFVPPMMFNNCGNMGLPLAVLAFGQAGLSAMVALFTISNLLQFTVGVQIVNRHAAFRPVFRHPMVIATFVGFTFAILQAPLPDWLMLSIKMTGDAMIPLMLISLGVRMATVSWGGWKCSVPTPPRPVPMAPIYAPTICTSPPCPILPIAGMARIEPEIAFVMSRGLAHRTSAYTEAEVRAAIGEARLVLELIGPRYADPVAASFPEQLADAISNHGLFVGPAVQDALDRPLGAFPIVIDAAGKALHAAQGKHPDGHPLRPLVWLANYLAEHREGLAAGQIVTTGSYCGVVDLPLDTPLRVRFGELGTLHVRFSALA